MADNKQTEQTPEQVAQGQQLVPEQPLLEESQVHEDEFSSEFGDEDYDSEIEGSGTSVAVSQSSKIIGIIAISITAVVVLFFIFKGEKEKSAEEDESKEVKVYNEAKDSNAPKFDVEPLPRNEIIEPIIEEIAPDKDDQKKTEAVKEPELPDLVINALPSEEEFGINPDFNEQDLFSQDDLKGSKEPENKDPDDPSDIDIDGFDNDIQNTVTTTQNGSPLVQQGNQQGVPQSNMVVFGLSQTTNKPNGSSTQNLENSSVEAISATKIEFPNRTIAQGKLIESVLETAINTDLEGKVRAIVSRDIFADFGKAILIPKGSRVIGSYSGNTTRGQTRVLINWERLIRPDSVDIQINSTTTDQFGRAGVPGNADNKYLELFNNSVLLSLVTIGTALAVEGASGSDGSTRTTDTTGEATTTTSASDLAAEQVINNIADTSQTVLDNVLNVNPTITVPHGTRIKIFVNQDLLFPANTDASDNSDSVIFIK